MEPIARGRGRGGDLRSGLPSFRQGPRSCWGRPVRHMARAPPPHPPLVHQHVLHPCIDRACVFAGIFQGRLSIGDIIGLLQARALRVDHGSVQALMSEASGSDAPDATVTAREVAHAVSFRKERVLVVRGGACECGGRVVWGDPALGRSL